MTKSILEGKEILAVDDNPKFLQVLEKEILEACPKCIFHKATSYIRAVEMMVCLTYDLVVLDIMGVRGFDLLNLAVMRNFPVTVLASNPLNPDALKRSIEVGARAYIPKSQTEEFVPFLEDALSSRYVLGWKRFLKKMKEFFGPPLDLNSEIRNPVS